MKKIFYALAFSLFTIGISFTTEAQTVVQDIFCESFDSTVWTMDTSFLPNPGPINHFYRDTLVTQDMSPGSAVDTARNGVRSYLTTPNVNISGFVNVGLIFEHICYLDASDDGTVEYSFDGGTTWARIPDFVNNGDDKVYGGNGVYNFLQGDFKFNKQSYASAWKFSDSTFLWTNANAEWRRETFDITPLMDLQPTAPDSVMIRFGLLDDPATPGRFGTHIWYIENFCIRGSDCEIVPPTIDMVDPPVSYPIQYDGRVYSTGPYNVDAQILDASLIDTSVIAIAHLRDTMGNGTFDTLDVDSIPMTRLDGGNFTGLIPKLIVGFRTPNKIDSVLPGDSIAWKLLAWDASDCRNVNQDPPAGYRRFLVINDLPKTCNTQPVFQYPYFQDFDGSDFEEGQSGDLSDGWSNPTGDFHDWWVNSGTTGGSSPSDTGTTGPTDDFPGDGKYLYVESTNPRSSTFNDSTAFLLSPCFDLTQGLVTNGLVKFYVNMNTSSLEDTINVDIYDPRPRPGAPFGRFVSNVIPPITGNQGNRWIPFEFTTYPFRNTVTQLRFRGTPGNSTGLSDMAMDSFKIENAPLIDLRLNPVALSPFTPCGFDEPVTVNVQNLGVDTARNITFGFMVCKEVNGVEVCDQSTIQTFTWNGFVPVGASIDVNFPSNLTFVVPPGEYTLKTWLTFTGDGKRFNDTTRAFSECIPYVSGLKYMDDFDGDTLWRTLGVTDSISTQNSWELGQPNFDRTDNLISEPNAWDVLLNRQYTGSGIVNILYSPLFDLTGSDSTIMSFLNNRDMDTTKDGVFIEYSFDRGISWDSLGARTDPQALRWYNNTLSGGGLGGTPVFSDMTGRHANTWGPGWLESELMLPDTFDNQPFVLFRFNFFAENDLDGNDGMSIDNFLLYDPEPLDITPQYALSPNDSCDLKVDQRFRTIFKNRGLLDVNTFDIEYRVKNLTFPGPEQVKSETINKLLRSRDTIHVYSSVEFDMFEIGNYQIDIITKLPGDGCAINDTMTRIVENIDGCSLKLVIATSHRPNFQGSNDSSLWEFNYTSAGKRFRVSAAYNDPKFGINTNTLLDTIENLFICIKKNSQVRFDLDDRDTLVESYSMIAYDGEEDTVLFENVRGGPESPTQFFNWNCPPERSASPLRIILDTNKIQLPISKDYLFQARLWNNGLDSMDNVDVEFAIDGNIVYTATETFPNPLRYNRTKVVGLGVHFLTPGFHELRASTSLPNRKNDELPNDDTTYATLFIMDTIPDFHDTSYTDTIFCEDFDGQLDQLWFGANSYNYRQSSIQNSFQLGTPSTANINSAASGQNAWVTNLDGDYPIIDESSLYSPWIRLRRDSCYRVSFRHNYHIIDSLNDGGTMEIGLDTSNGVSPELPQWFPFGNFNGDTGRVGQVNWFNTKHILSMPDVFVIEGNARGGVDTINLGSPSGWTGTTNGWQMSSNVFPSFIDSLSEVNDSSFFKSKNQAVTFRWRFESDASQNSEGWAIDDFCIQVIPQTECFSVGLQEADFDLKKAYLGQNIPNPAANNTSIPYYIPKAGQLEFELINMLGQPVLSRSISRPSGDGILQLNLSNMSKGVYFYTMKYDDKVFTKKMIIAE